QLIHRFVAVLIAAGVLLALILARKTGREAGMLSRFAGAWFLLVACQITLGAWVIWSNKAADIATAHVAVGATMFALGVALSAICLRLLQEHDATRLAGQSAVSVEIPVS
ncbi:MAG TPA: COX15/CtaA family protein, partial [Chthoniobacterales bacterium]|nr:COX15/CtaA family protein [Chthoniobacterales bacterium]